MQISKLSQHRQVLVILVKAMHRMSWFVLTPAQEKPISGSTIRNVVVHERDERGAYILFPLFGMGGILYVWSGTNSGCIPIYLASNRLTKGGGQSRQSLSFNRNASLQQKSSIICSTIRHHCNHLSWSQSHGCVCVGGGGGLLLLIIVTRIKVTLPGDRNE